MRRESCGGCGGADLEVFLDLGLTPLANTLPRSADAVETWYPLEVAVCPRCWLVQLLEVPPAAEVFGADYAFYSGTSPALVRYHEGYATKLLRRWPDQARKLVVEVACNDGDLLRHLATGGNPALGIDPALGPVTVARGRGLNVLNEGLTVDSAERVRSEYGAAGLVVANHVTAHVEDLPSFLTAIRTLLDDDGVAVLEVQYLADLLTGNQLDHVYHEHRFFLSVSALARVARRQGLDVIRVDHVEPQGGSVQVTLSRCDKYTAHESVNRTFLSESWLRRRESYAGVQGRAEHVRDKLLRSLDQLKADGRILAGYGLPAKATTLLNFCDIGPDALDFIVDTTPHKIGRLAPGVGIPVVGPGNRPDPDVYVLLVWNYLAGVLRRERRFTDNGGRFLVPIPTPVLL